MGSTGKSAAPITTQNAVSQGLADTADSDTVQKYYKDNFGIEVGGSYFKDNLDPKILARTSEVLDRLVAELGKDTFDEMGIKIVSYSGIKGRAYAQTDLASRRITVNPAQFKDYDSLKASVHGDVQSGFHPKGTKAGDIIVHEFGHNLEFLINQRQNQGNKLNMCIADAQQTYSKAIVRQAYAELKAEQPNLYKTEKHARASISKYADSKWHGATAYTECMAEAVSDYGRNGKNANPLSIKIWEGIKAMLK